MGGTIQPMTVTLVNIGFYSVEFYSIPSTSCIEYLLSTTVQMLGMSQ